MITILSVLCIGFCLTSWAFAYLYFTEKHKKPEIRFIRPAEITVNRHYHVTEYAVTEPEMLDLDFPNGVAEDTRCLYE